MAPVNAFTQAARAEFVDLIIPVADLHSLESLICTLYVPVRASAQ